MRKKLGLLLVISIMLVAVVGCGSSGSGKQYKIAISQIVEHPSLDATREGFLAALKDSYNFV